MRLNCDPKVFPDRVIVVDLTMRPPVEKVNCLGYGSVAAELFKNAELCWTCYCEWSKKFTEQWLKERFG